MEGELHWHYLSQSLTFRSFKGGLDTDTGETVLLCSSQLVTKNGWKSSDQVQVLTMNASISVQVILVSLYIQWRSR